MNDDRRSLDPHVADLIAGVARIEEGVIHIKETVADHSPRIRSLELTRSRQKGIGATLAGVAAVVGSVLGYWKS